MHFCGCICIQVINAHAQVAEKKKEDHVLVTSGIYSLVRHPGYFGWFWWSVGTQILMFNPICAVGFAVRESLMDDDGG